MRIDYKLGLERLERLLIGIGIAHSSNVFGTFTGLKGDILANLDEERQLAGLGPAEKIERKRIIRGLDRLSLQCLQLAFIDLCDVDCELALPFNLLSEQREASLVPTKRSELSTGESNDQPTITCKEKPMRGIPQTLLLPLRQALMDCDELYSPRQLRAVFRDETLSPWRDGLPLADNVGEQVDILIDYLANKRRSNGESALVLLLKALAGRKSSDEELQGRLIKLAEQLDWLAGRPAKPESAVLEANPEAAQMLWTADAERMLACARSVARIETPRYLDGKPGGEGNSGTAWLVAPGLALTCWHVIETRGEYDGPIDPADLQAQVSNALLTFDYIVAGKGLQYGVAALEHPTLETQTLDYAVLRLKDRGDAPLRGRGYLRLDIEAPLTTHTSLYIIQHPLGQPQQSAGDVFRRSSPTAGRILYKTPTEPGTSGAPVFNRVNWHVVALHNGENQAARLREGTLLKSILADLEGYRPDLHREIMAAQRTKE